MKVEAFEHPCVENAHEADAIFSATAEVIPCADDRRMLLAHIHLKYVAKNLIELDGGTECEIKITVGQYRRNCPMGR